MYQTNEKKDEKKDEKNFAPADGMLGE